MPRRLLVRIGLILLALLLLRYWLEAMRAAQSGRMFAYNTYWNAPVGTITLFILLTVLTPAWAWFAWRYWNWQGYNSADQAGEKSNDQGR